MTKTVNTRVYQLTKKEIKATRIQQIWAAVLVIHGCLMVASADLKTLTLMTLTFMINWVLYTLNKEA